METDENKLVFKFIIFLLLWAIISTIGFNLKITNNSEKTISVQGQGSVFVMPDKAEIYVYVKTEGKNATQVQEENAETMDRVMKAVRGNISTYSYYLSPKTAWNESTGENYIYGYSLTHTIKIITLNISDVGNIIDSAIKAGANGVNYVNFLLSDEKEKQAYGTALEKAAKEAKEKALSIAESAGTNIIGIKQITESRTYYSPLRMEAGSTSINPTEIEISAEISADYLISSY